MNKQEAISILQEDIKRYSKKEFPENTESIGLQAVLRHRKGKVEAYQMAISALEHQLTNGWIPVSERLPKKSGWYYTTVRRKDSGERMLGMNEFYVSDFRVLFGHIEVIAWKEEKPYTEVS